MNMNVKEEANYRKLGSNPKPKTKYTTLKSQKAGTSISFFLPDLETPYKFFATVGPKLASLISPKTHRSRVSKKKKSIDLSPIDVAEVTKFTQKMRNKKNSGQNVTSRQILKSSFLSLEPELV